MAVIEPMKRNLIRWVFFTTITAACACQQAFPKRAATLLRGADTLQVLSLDPTNGAIDPKGFHRWPVVGEVLIGDTDRKPFVDAVIRGAKPQSEASPCEIAPRHGIRASSKEGTVDFVICFECGEVQVFYSQGGEEYLEPNSILAAILSETLTKAKIPVIPSPFGENAVGAPKNVRTACADPRLRPLGPGDKICT